MLWEEQSCRTHSLSLSPSQETEQCEQPVAERQATCLHATRGEGGGGCGTGGGGGLARTAYSMHDTNPSMQDLGQKSE